MRFDNFLSFFKALDEERHRLSNMLIVCPELSLRSAALEKIQRPDRVVLEDPDQASLYQALYSPSLFTRQEQLIVHFNDAPAKEIVALLQKPSVSTQLIVTLPKLAAQSPLLGSFALVYLQGEIKPWDLESMLVALISHEAQKTGVRLSSDCAVELVRRSDSDLLLLQQEWRKLLCYVGERRMVTKEDLAQVSAEPSSQTLWRLGDACLKKNPKALIMAQDLLAEGVSSIALIRALRNQYRRHLEQHTSKEAARHLIRIDETECQLKSRSVDDTALIDLLLCHLLV